MVNQLEKLRKKLVPDKAPATPPKQEAERLFPNPDIGLCAQQVQELYCIETLARVDVLCLDKTGTITEGTMDCKDLVLPDDSFEADAPKALASLVAALEDRNATFSAIKKTYSDPTPWAATKTAPFSSRTKWSGATFEGQGTYILGAAASADCVFVCITFLPYAQNKGSIFVEKV